MIRISYKILILLYFTSSCGETAIVGSNSSGKGKSSGLGNNNGSGKDNNVNSKEITDKSKNEFNVKNIEAIKNTLAQAKPAMAVRAPGCLMCHAKIHSNMITDLGYGDPFFLGGKPGFELQENYYKFTDHVFHNKYSNAYSNSWQSATIKGDLIIPKIAVAPSEASFLSLYVNQKATFSLKDIFVDDHRYKDEPNKQFFTTKLLKIQSNQTSQEPGFYGQFQEKSKVYIGAPTNKDILDLFAKEGMKVKFDEKGIKVSLYKDSIIDGLKVIESGNSAYLSWTGVGTCDGDIIIDGVLHINKLTMNTKFGCRIYANKSIFVTEEVKYKGSDKPTLQLSSARSINLGVKQIEFRSTYFRNGLRNVTSKASQDEFFKNILNDRDLVKDLIEDAGPFWALFDVANNQPLGYSFSQNKDAPDHKFLDLNGNPITSIPSNAKVGFAEGFKRKSFNQTGLLINAPIVNSRYFGSFKGIVIAEDALFAVGKFEYTYDNSFDYVEFLPLLKGKILVIED